MNKKVYLVPKTLAVQIEASAILSGSTGATGEDIPWASAKSRNDIDDNDDIFGLE